MSEFSLKSRSHKKSGREFALEDEELVNRATIYRPDMMAGKRVVVTGGGTGIGKATAILFARLGADVAICGRRQDKLDEAGELIGEATGKTVMKSVMNIRDADSVEIRCAARSTLSRWRRPWCTCRRPPPLS